MSRWRLTLDEPYSFATEPGFVKSLHGGDFRVQKEARTNTWYDPVSNVLMLQPSFLNSHSSSDFHPLADFRAQVAIMKATKRSADKLHAITTGFPSNYTPSMIQILSSVAIVAIGTSVANQDDMVWALESSFQIPADGAFAIHYYGISDELIRANNWFMLQWGGIGLHFDYKGTARAYAYSGDAVSNQIYQFDFAQPGELLNQHGYMAFIPIPGLGLLMVHRHAPPGQGVSIRNAASSASRGHLIPFPSHVDGGGNLTMIPASQIRVGLNPYRPITISFQDITFAASGSYIDAPFDPGFNHSVGPDFVTPLAIKSSAMASLPMTATATLRNKADTADWAPGTDRQARIKVALSSPNNRYTPFIYGHGVQWSPILTTRATTALVISTQAGGIGTDVLTGLEYTQHESGQGEGTAAFKLQSAAGKKIAERGDATWRLEYSNDGGSTWTTLDGGLAKKWHFDPVITKGGMHYEATCKLFNYYERLDEEHMIVQTAFDGVTPGDSMNKVLIGAGFPPVLPLPSDLTSFTLPPSSDQNRWRLAPREGDKGGDILLTLLLFMRSQNIEWRARFDWPTYLWVFEKKPRDLTNFWTLSPKVSDKNAGARIWPYGLHGTVQPEPPEGNVFQVEGMTSNDPRGERILSNPIVNYPSLNDPTSVDYLGRSVTVTGKLWPISDESRLFAFARMYFDAAGHRRHKIDDCPLPEAQLLITPCTRVKLADDTGAIYFDGWVKKRTITILQDGLAPFGAIEQMSLSLDTIWEGELN